MNEPIFSFGTLSGEEFEELCVAILSQESRGFIVERYGRSGQKQFGVDILGIQAATGEIVAVECKRRDQISLRLLKSITDKFWRNKERWRKKGVRRFIICIAAEIRDRRINDLWLNETRRFRDVGIVLEVWSARALTDKISKFGDIKRRFFPHYGVFERLQAPEAEQAELNRVSVNTSQQMDRMGLSLSSSPFGSLLKAFNDEANASERKTLEAYLLDKASAVNFTLNHPSSGIRLLRHLIEIPNLYQNWKFRRTLGRIAAEFVSPASLDSKQRLQVRDFAEHCFERPDTSILLAVTATVSPYAARTLGAPVLERLIFQQHPQVRWLMIRGWSIIEPLVSSSMPLPRLLESGDQWIRRRFLLTLIRGLNSESNSSLKSLLAEHVKHDSRLTGGTRFETALGTWLSLKSGIDLGILSDRDISHGDTDLALLIDSLKLRPNPDDIHRFAAALDYHCISLDYSSSPQALHIGGSYSEGRYGIIRQWVEEGLSSVHEDLLFTFIDGILDCADEGVRWAISASMSNWLPKIASMGQRRQLIFKLLNDWHPWIIRESLEQIGRSLSNLRGLDQLELLAACSASIGRSIEQGWEEKEFLPGYLKVLSYYPESVEHITLRI